ncbi:Uncharacterised protein [Vibrio cholerae]|nr:Uncharacterised protein [Vibrio cholerae]CSA46676.1 Uncharacterised protein [Vibrio cholerae]CSB02289.1 Uncharacterised protein [Vibrio cholerae]CSB49770.1 Uncharacterised protein [Vibrio cholerae]CSB75934.1 Uncharacterised protein [Vibrio cholerae]
MVANDDVEVFHQGIKTELFGNMVKHHIQTIDKALQFAIRFLSQGKFIIFTANLSHHRFQ